jgi:hypothetical protein
MSLRIGAIPPMRLMALRNLLTNSGGIQPDPRPMNLARTIPGIGAKSFQIIGVTDWYTPDGRAYNYNVITDGVGQNLDILA